jgi:cytochrome c oxidase subunit 6b
VHVHYSFCFEKKIFTQEIPPLNKEEMARLEMVKNVRTTPRDLRFPHQNQALHCWNRYNQWLVCEEENQGDCAPMRQLAASICPSIWTDQWDEQREAGSFVGIGSRFYDKAH